LEETTAQMLQEVEDRRATNQRQGHGVCDEESDDDDNECVTVSGVGNKPRSWTSRTLHKRVQELEKMVVVYQQQCKHLDNEMKKFKLLSETTERTLKERTQNVSPYRS